MDNTDIGFFSRAVIIGLLLIMLVIMIVNQIDTIGAIRVVGHKCETYTINLDEIKDLEIEPAEQPEIN